MRQKKLKENFRYQHQARNCLQQTAEPALIFYRPSPSFPFITL